jgi:hypothetical protein
MQCAVALAERIHGPDDPTVGTTLNNLATLYKKRAASLGGRETATSKS